MNQSSQITTNSINTLLSYTYKIELYIVVVLFPERDDHQHQNRPAAPHFFIHKSGKNQLVVVIISFSTHQPRIETALLPHLIVVLCIVGDGICYRVRYHPISYSTYTTKKPLGCREEVLLHNQTTTPVQDIAVIASRKVLKGDALMVVVSRVHCNRWPRCIRCNITYFRRCVE